MIDKGTDLTQPVKTRVTGFMSHPVCRGFKNTMFARSVQVRDIVRHSRHSPAVPFGFLSVSYQQAHGMGGNPLTASGESEMLLCRGFDVDAFCPTG